MSRHFSRHIFTCWISRHYVFILPPYAGYCLRNDAPLSGFAAACRFCLLYYVITLDTLIFAADGFPVTPCHLMLAD